MLPLQLDHLDASGPGIARKRSFCRAAAQGSMLRRLRICVLRIAAREQREEITIQLLVVVANVLLQTLANIVTFSARSGVALPARGLIDLSASMDEVLRKAFAHATLRVFLTH